MQPVMASFNVQIIGISDSVYVPLPGTHRVMNDEAGAMFQEGEVWKLSPPISGEVVDALLSRQADSWLAESGNI